MKIIKNILIGIVVVILAMAVVGLFLPSAVKIERSIVIDATSASVYEELVDLNKIQKWSPWYQIDPEGTTYEFTGSDSGVGQKMAWSSENSDVGSGSQEIVEVIENEKVRTELYFGDMEGASYADLLVSSVAEGTKVVWTYEGDMGGNPMLRILGLFMDQMLGGQYEAGMANLKARVESKPIFTVDLSEESAEPINYVAIREKFDLTNPESIGPKMGAIFGQLMGYIAENGVMAPGMPLSVYHESTPTVWDADISIPVAEALEIEHDQIIAGTTTGGKVVKGIHMGDYFKLEETHKQVRAYMTFNELQPNGKPYEIYVSDPSLADTAKWQTDVYYPVK